MPAFSYRLWGRAVGSFIDISASVSGLILRLTLPAGITAAQLALRPLLQFTGTGILKLASRVAAARSPQVHPQHGARATANINAATGSSKVSLGIHPAPINRSAFSKLLARVNVKALCQSFASHCDASQKIVLHGESGQPRSPGGKERAAATQQARNAAATFCR